MATGKLLCSTGSSARCSVMTERDGMGGVVGERLKREGIYVYIWLIHFLVKLSQHCKAIILQWRKTTLKLSITWRPAEAGSGMAVCFTVLEINQEVQSPTSRQHNWILKALGRATAKIQGQQIKLKPRGKNAREFLKWLISQGFVKSVRQCT